MAEPQGAVVIRDNAGTEHEFPVGFDPQRAAAIVRQQTAPADTVPRDARGRPAVSSDSGETPSIFDKVNEALGPLAHPDTLTDFARILTMPVDTVRKAAASALAMAAAKGVAAASRGPVGNAIGATGRGLEAVGNSRAARSAEAGGLAEAAFSMDPKGLAVAATPTVLRFAGRGLQRAGAAVAGAAPAASEAAPAVAEVGPAAQAATEAATTPRPTGNALPDQKALNEAALAARRAEYAARQMSEMIAQGAARAGAEPIVPISGQMKLTGPEFKVWQRLVNGGMKYQDAEQAVKDARDLADKLGTPRPTIAETKFPKGMRGKSQ